MNHGDLVRYTSTWLRSDSVPRHEVVKRAKMIGHVESAYAGTLEVSWPGTRRPNELVPATQLEIVQEGGR